MDYYSRHYEQNIIASLANFPVTAVTGPRQCGKSTLVNQLVNNMGSDDYVYLDLERPSDLAKLDNAEWFLSAQKGKLVCIDEIQRKP